jgi:hypothetical protein
VVFKDGILLSLVSLIEFPISGVALAYFEDAHEH